MDASSSDEALRTPRHIRIVLIRSRSSNHISTVFSRRHVYKVKKRYGWAFSTFSTLERAGTFCEEEVRSTAARPDTYLGVGRSASIERRRRSDAPAASSNTQLHAAGCPKPDARLPHRCDAVEPRDITPSSVCSPTSHRPPRVPA